MTVEALMWLVGVVQVVMVPVGIAAVGWLIRVSSRLTAIEAILDMHKLNKMDSTRVHEDHEKRLRILEHGYAECPNCVAKEGSGG